MYFRHVHAAAKMDLNAAAAGGGRGGMRFVSLDKWDGILYKKKGHPGKMSGNGLLLHIRPQSCE